MRGMRHDRPYGGEQPRVVVHLKLGSGRVSGHCHWSPRRGRRMPRGSPDNNTIHRRKVECCIATDRNNRTFRRCTASPACHIVSRGPSQNRISADYIALDN